MVEIGFQAAAASKGTCALPRVLVFLSVGTFLILVGWFLAFWWACSGDFGSRDMWCVSSTHHGHEGVPARVLPQRVDVGVEGSTGTAAAAGLVGQTAGACAFDGSASLVDFGVLDVEVDREDRPNTAG